MAVTRRPGHITDLDWRKGGMNNDWRILGRVDIKLAPCSSLVAKTCFEMEAFLSGLGQAPEIESDAAWDRLSMSACKGSLRQ